MAETARDRHAASIKSLLDMGKYSDLVITCGADTHKVHKNIVCTRCGFFERAERFGKEAASGVINLPEDEPVIVKLLLEFLYTSEYKPNLIGPAETTLIQQLSSRIPPKLRQSYPHSCVAGCYKSLCDHHTCRYYCQPKCDFMICNICCPSVQVAPLVPEGEPEQLLLHSKMYTIADKYDVPGLKELAREKFQRSCKAFGKNQLFITAAEHVFTTTADDDDGLRASVRDTLVENKRDLGRRDIQSFLEARPALMYTVLLRAAQSLGVATGQAWFILMREIVTAYKITPAQNSRLQTRPRAGMISMQHRRMLYVQ